MSQIRIDRQGAASKLPVRFLDKRLSGTSNAAQRSATRPSGNVAAPQARKSKSNFSIVIACGNPHCK